MASLFIALYLGEHVIVLVAALLRGRGFSALTTHGEGRLGLSDADPLAHSVSLNRTPLTHNRADFEALARRYPDEGYEHCGTILARRYPLYEFLRRLMRLLDQVTADEMKNQVKYI